MISPEGHILTNWHVVVDEDGEPADLYFILVTDPNEPELAPGLAYAAILVDGEPALDLALLQVVLLPTGEPLPIDWIPDFVTIGNSDALLPGDWVTVVGYPGISGETITVTTGIVSGFVAEDASSSGREWIKTDAKLAHGNSGGGAFDSNGLLIGVPTVRKSRTTANFVESQELLRPIAMAVPMLERTIAGFPESLARASVSLPGEDRTDPGSTAAPEQAAAAPSAPGRPSASPQPITPAPTPPGPPAKAALPASTSNSPVPASSTPVEISGRLGGVDAIDEQGKYVDEYRVQLAAGDTVTIEVSSSSFDPAARLLTPNGSVAFDVDDSPNHGLNVSERYEAATSGSFTLLVTSAYAQEAGEYSLTIAGAREVVSSSTPSTSAVTPPASTGVAEGALTASSRLLEGGYYFDTFEVRMDSRALVSILVSSFAFEPAVALVGPDGDVEVTFGEASVSEQEATVAYIPARSGSYTIYVSSAAPGRTGPFKVAVTGAELAVAGVASLPRSSSSAGSDSASQSSTLPVDGYWQGSVLDSVMGRGQATIRLQQTGSAVVGTWQVVFPAGTNGGLAQGQLRGQEAVLELIPLDPGACPFRAIVSLTGSTLVGTYQTLECTVLVTGTFSLSRR